jgi:hypothetical protein
MGCASAHTTPIIIYPKSKAEETKLPPPQSITAISLWDTEEFSRQCATEEREEESQYVNWTILEFMIHLNSLH